MFLLIMIWEQSAQSDSVEGSGYRYEKVQGFASVNIAIIPGVGDSQGVVGYPKLDYIEYIECIRGCTKNALSSTIFSTLFFPKVSNHFFGRPGL